jgi:hypothetical protein
MCPLTSDGLRQRRESAVGEGDIGEVGYGSGTRSFCRRRGKGIFGRGQNSMA